MSIEYDDRYVKKDWFTCTRCKEVNIINITKESKHEKRQRNLWTNDPTWFLFRSLAGEFGMDHNQFLSFLLGRLQRERESYDTAVRS